MAQLGELSGDALADAADRLLAAEELASALTMYDRAEPWVGDPDRCAGGRWMAHMLAGDYLAAWGESDAIRRRGRPDPHRFWLGEPLRGKRLMLRSLHGFGDAVMMFRFLPRLRKRAAGLVVEVAPQMVELARCFAGADGVVTWGEGAPAEAPLWDVQMEVMEIPYALRLSSGDLEPRRDYLRVPAGARERVAKVAGRRGRPRVGLVWSAGEWNPSRSVPFPEFQRLLEVRGVEFWSLQGGAARGDWHGVEGQRDVYEVGDGLLPLAATIEKMDLVLTVDSVAAHMAGALGVPCWVLLQRFADWRWMRGREDSPWYPTLRLKRQGEAGEWGELVGRVRVALEAFVQQIS